MIRLAVFDLDGTLAPLGKPAAPETVALLRQLEEAGVRIALCSGKPTYYLCGFARQLGLADPILVGENGAVIQFGVDLPPREYRVLPYSQAAKQGLRHLRREIEAILPGLWYQPNEVGLTPFPATPEEFDQIADCVERNREYLKDVEVYRHGDSFDITPKGISKATGLAYLAHWLGISAAEAAAVGDGVNDYPMFAWAGLALGVHVGEPDRVYRNFDSPAEALRYLLKIRDWS